MKTFQLSDQHLQIILAALAELPFRVSAAVIQELHRQATEEKEG
jgi:hypothetical protein